MPGQHPLDLRERVFEFACAVVVFCRELSTKSGVDRQIAWQLAAPATSVGSNLEEAKAAYSRRDFAAKNAISLKEVREALYWLRVIERCRLAPFETVEPLLAEAGELTAMLTAGMKRLRPVALRVPSWSL
jgi:four helix bundle protein